MRPLVPGLLLLLVGRLAASDGWLPAPSIARWDAEHGIASGWSSGWSTWSIAPSWAPTYGCAPTYGSTYGCAPVGNRAAPWWVGAPPVVLEVQPPLDEPTTNVRIPGGWEQVGDTEVWVPDALTTEPAGTVTRHQRHGGGASRQAPDVREDGIGR